MARLTLPRRRHELVLVLLLLAAAGLFGFWVGRATAPDPGVAYLRGKADGAAVERVRSDQNQIDMKILRSEADATRTASKTPDKKRRSSSQPSSTETAAEETETTSETAVGATN